MGLEVQIERVRASLIRMMGRKSYLRPAGLIEAVAKDIEDSQLTVRQCIGRLAKEGWLQGASADGIPYGQVRIVDYAPPPPDPALERWKDAMGKAGMNACDIESLYPLGTKLEQFTDEEQVSILNGLLMLRSKRDEERGHHRFVVSAKYLLGSSKLLDELPAVALRKFGIETDDFPGHPQYVVVAGGAHPEAVILVENPAAFELAISTKAAERYAFIATFGFGLSKSQEEYGNQLVSMVDGRFANTITLKREGSMCPTAKELLSHPQITFWGDLDLAGMQIYLRLKRSIPGIMLSALYRPMVEAITAHDSSHPYVKAVGKLGQDGMPASYDNQLVMELLALCQNRGVDQETVNAAKIEELAGLVYDSVKPPRS